MRSLLPTFLAVLSLSILSHAQSGTDAPIDWERARQLHQRQQRGESLSAADRADLQRAIAAREPRHSTPAGKVPLGIKPLTELSGEEKYKGESGGLYGAGHNEPTGDLLAAAKRESAKIKPVEGKIGLVS